MPVDTKEVVTVQPFGIEADHPRNCDLLLQSIPNMRLRSMISGSKTVTDASNGLKMVPPNQAAFLGQFPPIPGMQLHVNPAKLTYTVIDPLCDDEELCGKIKAALDRVGMFRQKGKLTGVEKQTGTLNTHRMKTCVRELLWLVEAGEARVIKGAMPTLEMIDTLPGHYLLNPGSRVWNGQPQFEKDFETWVDQLIKAGG